MLRITLLALGTLVALLVALGIALSVGLSTGLAVPFMERQASAFLDRKVHIGVPPKLKLGSTLWISLGELRIDNTDWAGPAPLLSLQQLELRLDTRSLLKGRLDVHDLQLEGLRLALAVDAEGNDNFPEILQSSEPSKEDASNDTDVSHPMLRNASITDVEFIRVNQQTDAQLHLRINELHQSAPGVEQRLQLRGDGTLQERNWHILVDGSSLNSLLNGENLSADFEASLAELSIKGDFNLPVINEPRDLSLHATLAGSLPERIASLSSLLDADVPMTATLDVTDIDPGVAIDLHINFNAINLMVSGSVERPGSGDGLKIELALDAANLPRIARALGLGETAEFPLDLSAEVTRDGTRLTVSNVDIYAGEHQLSGNIFLPLLPGTDDAELDLRGTGPDFAFYQRLLNQPPSLAAPYELQLQILANQNGSERVDASLSIGAAELTFNGLLGEFPSYRGSDLRMHLEGPSLKALGQSFDIVLPDGPYAANSQVQISDASIARITQLNVQTLGLEATLSGELHSYPELDDLDLTLKLSAPSIAVSSLALEIPELGDVPLDVEITAQGSLRDISLSDVSIRAGGLAVSRTGGTLRFLEGKPKGDLRLTVTADRLNELLGSLANPRIPEERISAELHPSFSTDQFALAIEKLSGPNVTGRANLQLSPELRIDERTFFETDLQILALADILPPQTPYSPPDTMLSLHAETGGTSAGKRIEVVLSNPDRELLKASIALPSQAAPDLNIAVRGAGPALRALGSVESLPQGPLPYDIDIETQILDGVSTLTLNKLELAGTLIQGTLHVDQDSRHLSGALNIPQAELGIWLASLKQPDEATEPTEESPNDDGRLIPDTPLPLEIMDSYSTDLRITTGPLGIEDPLLDGGSLIDSVSIHLVSDARQAKLVVDNALGSRGSLAAELTLKRSDDGAELETKLTLRELLLGFTSRGDSLKLLPRHDLDMLMRGRGLTLRQLAATLDGSIYLTGGAGTLTDMSLSFATESFIAQLFSTLLPTLKTDSPDMQVQCTVLAVRASEGVLALDPGFVFRTKRVDLAARGEIDLRDETLKVRFDNQARKGFGISAASLVNPYVQITGSLASPALGLNLTSSAISGGAAVASGGLTVLAKPLFGRFLKRNNPCTTAQERWLKVD